MKPMDCEAALRDVALGHAERAEAHLKDCDGCRREAALVGKMLEALANSATVLPPRDVDDRVRRLLVGPTVTSDTPPPVTAVGIAVGAYSALVWAVSIVLAETSLAEVAPALSWLLAAAYLGVCSVATLPLLIRRAPLRRPVREEVLP